MNIQDIMTLVGTLGFPIAAYIGLFWFVNKTLNSITDALNQNTLVMTKLAEKLDRLNDHQFDQ